MFKKFELPELPFDAFSFQGLSPESFDFHHNRHHKTYVDNLNALLEDEIIANKYAAANLENVENSLQEIIKESYKNFQSANQCFYHSGIIDAGTKISADKKIFNNAAQHWNHSFFWNSICVVTKSISAQLAKLIESSFGSVEKFKDEFYTKGSTLFGSGWVWLVYNKESMQLEIISTVNAHTPIITDNLHPLLVCDVWEHAYYIDYRNKRVDFLKVIIESLNWEFAQQRLSDLI